MKFHLDLTTLFFMQVVLYLGNILFTLFLHKSRFTYKGARFWIGAQIAIPLAIIGYYFRPILHPVIGIGLTNGIYILGIVLFIHSIWNFRFRTPFPRGFYAIPVIIALVMVILIPQSVNVRSIIFNTTAAILCFILFLMLHVRIELYFRLGGHLIGIPFLLFSLGLFFRTYLAIISPSTNDFYNIPESDRFTMLLSIMGSSVTLFGYYILSGSRLERDISRKAQELKLQNDLLQRAHTLQGQLMSIITHDLQGPIGGSVRYLNKHLRNNPEIPERHRDSLGIVASSLERSHQLLGNILLWNKTQNKSWIIRKEAIELAPMVASICELKATEAQSKGILFDMDGVGGQAYGDLKSIETIIRNLLSNAIKFSMHHKTIRMWTETVGNLITLNVQDDGIGMSETQIEKLFQIDRPISTRGTDGETGTGLGLILSKEFAELNNGNLILISRPGRGTTARLSLPLLT